MIAALLAPAAITHDWLSPMVPFTIDAIGISFGNNSRMPYGLPAFAFLSDDRHAVPIGSIWSRPLSKNDLGHHSLIFMVQEMAMEQRGTSDDGIGEIHHQICRALHSS